MTAALQLVLVEDEGDQIEQYEAVLEDYVERLDRPINMGVCRTVEEAHERVDSTVDAVIVDLTLGRDRRDGAEVIEELRDHFRVPVVILTGTPANADKRPPVVRVFTKGKHGFDEVLDYLWGIYHTGLTRIMGGRGLLEERLDRVFKTNLLPLLDVWITYGAADAKRTERALLRFALGHLVADLEGDETPCYPEEVYLAPPLEDALTTGTVVRGKDDRARHVVMTPACDLVIRDGKTKAKSVVLVEIVSEGDVFGSLKGKARDRRRREERLRSNSADYCYHWLPKSRHVDGGFLDFRRLHTIPMDRLNDEFEHPSVHVQIAPSFIKDIVSRFAAFYARQGQPVIRSATTDP